jgi:uncharacterized membrane protein YfhO
MYTQQVGYYFCAVFLEQVGYYFCAVFLEVGVSHHTIIKFHLNLTGCSDSVEYP